MCAQFPLFNTPIDLAHHYWKKILSNEDWAIDATCGNGKDTLALAQMIGSKGGIIGLDIQEIAIQNTRYLLESMLQKEQLPQIQLFTQSHASFPLEALDKPIRLIVYNLGYLPGGNKQITTLRSSTLESLRQALGLILEGGAISITCYPGHSEGEKELKDLLIFSTSLSTRDWNVCHHTWINRQKSPSLLIIQKKLSNC